MDGTARNGNSLPSAHRSDDPVDWVENSWRKCEYPDIERFLAMTSLVRLHHLMTDAMSAVLKRSDLTVNSYFLMLTVQLSDNGALLLNQIATRTMVHPTTVTLLLDRLERQGLLIREPHPTDRRATYARITPAGSALTSEVTRALQGIEFGVPGLTKPIAKQLVSLLRPIRARLGDMYRHD